MQAVSLIHTYEKRQNDLAAGKTGKAVAAVSAKRASVLDHSLDDYQRWAARVEQGYLLAAKFLRRHCDMRVDASDIYLGARATEREVKHLSETGELARYRIVHFATHGALAGQVTGNTEPGLL